MVNSRMAICLPRGRFQWLSETPRLDVGKPGLTSVKKRYIHLIDPIDTIVYKSLLYHIDYIPVKNQYFNRNILHPQLEDISLISSRFFFKNSVKDCIKGEFAFGFGTV